MKKETQMLLEKASHAIHAAKVLLEEDEIDFSAGRAYYAMFFVAEALLFERNIKDLRKLRPSMRRSEKKWPKPKSWMLNFIAG